jgi:hypothetical protein
MTGLEIRYVFGLITMPAASAIVVEFKGRPGTRFFGEPSFKGRFS